METIYIIIIAIVIVIINLIIIFLYFNGFFNSIKPSDLNLFKDFSLKINPSLLDESTQVYNEAVSKYFEILNKYALIDNKNINTICREIADNFVFSNIDKFMRKNKDDIVNYKYILNVFGFFKGGNAPDGITNEDFNTYIVPLLNKFFKGQINITDYDFKNGKLTTINYPNNDPKLIFSQKNK
jgi:hypothetical protein